MFRRAFALFGGILVLCSCGGVGDDTIDVLAASSMIDVAERLELLLEAELGANVRFSFGSSGSFFEQLDQGAPAAAVITANRLTMDRMEVAGLVEGVSTIATNDMAIVTTRSSSGLEIASLEDLADVDGAIVVLCASSAPCGQAADEVLARAGLDVSPASREPTARATLNKVALGEADAAIVFRTDAHASDGVRVIDIDPVVNVSVDVRAGAVVGAASGAAVVTVFASEAARQIFDEAGFGSP